MSFRRLPIAINPDEIAYASPTPASGPLRDRSPKELGSYFESQSHQDDLDEGVTQIDAARSGRASADAAPTAPPPGHAQEPAIGMRLALIFGWRPISDAAHMKAPRLFCAAVALQKLVRFSSKSSVALYGPAPQSELGDNHERLFAKLHSPPWINSADADQTLASQIRFDPDLWIIETEDRLGRSFLEVIE